jgi:hypothetical protein
MDNDSKMEALVTEIERIKQSLIRSETSYFNKVKKLTTQLKGLEEAVKILKNR